MALQKRLPHNRTQTKMLTLTDLLYRKHSAVTRLVFFKASQSPVSHFGYTHIRREAAARRGCCFKWCLPVITWTLHSSSDPPFLAPCLVFLLAKHGCVYSFCSAVALKSKHHSIHHHYVEPRV